MYEHANYLRKLRPANGRNVQSTVPSASSISDLLRRLGSTLLPTWATQRRLHPQPPQAGSNPFAAASNQALDAVRGASDWRTIPFLLCTLSHDSAAIRNAGASVIADLAAFIPLAELPGFERRLRGMVCRAYPWNELPMESVVKKEWPPRVWAIFTMHPSGYVREAALRQISAAGDFNLALPYLLLRVYDWVSQVRTVAKSAVEDLLATTQVDPWIPVLGLLEHLRLRSREDHSWLIDQVTSLFLRPESRPKLMDAARSVDPGVARWAFRAGMKLPSADRAEFISHAIKSDDSVVRLRVAGAVRAWKECPGRERFLASMAADRFMPIRRESLYAALEADPNSRRATLRAALLDRHASMRDAARFYLRKEPTETGAPFDARAFYLNALATDQLAKRAAAIAGLGECGSKTDADTLAAFVKDRRPSIAAAAVRAVASLDRDNRTPWLIDLLRDDRPSVAKEACRSLVLCSSAVPVEALRNIHLSDQREHSRRFALRLLLRNHPYDAVVDAIVAAGSGNTRLVQAGSEFIMRAAPWTVSYGPSDSQKAAAESAIAGLPRALPEDLRKRLRDFMGLVVA